MKIVRYVSWCRPDLLALVLMIGGCAHDLKSPMQLPANGTATTRSETGRRSTGQGDRINYTLVLPQNDERTDEKWPIVILLHAFARNHARQVGNAQEFAKRGLAVLVPDMTTLMTLEYGRRKNVEHLEDHLAWLRKRNRTTTDPLNGRFDLDRIGVAGHSAGGGIAVEFAIASGADGSEFPVDAVALMDGVPWKRTIRRINSGQSTAALLSIRADASVWNAQGIVREAERAWKGAVTAVHLRGTSHIDPENPPDPIVDWLLGSSSPERRKQYSELAAEFLAAELLGSAQAVGAFREVLESARKNGDEVVETRGRK